jgi:hypothetical protein
MGILLQFYCDVWIAKGQASYCQPDGGFSSVLFTAYVVLLHIFKEQASFYFTPQLKLFEKFEMLDCFL